MSQARGKQQVPEAGPGTFGRGIRMADIAGAFRARYVPLFLAATALPLVSHPPVAASGFRTQTAARSGQQANESTRGAPQGSRADRTLFGITPFPYDLTMEAVQRTRETIIQNSTLCALQFDDGIPWKEALADAPLPQRIRREWEAQAAAIPRDRVLYVALAPLDTDRKSLAPATGEQKRLPMPAELAGAALDSEPVRRAYLNYAGAVVRQFHPRYLNLGVEAGELMNRDFARWPQFVALYAYVRQTLKREFPNMWIGISFGLGDLRIEREAKAALPLIAQCDYVGVSFYPWASGFDEKFGAPPYGAGAVAWRKPLAWLRRYTNKPLAVCETGYSTQPVLLPQYGLTLPVDAGMQQQYVQELFRIARRDRYAFVVWFLAIDYDRLYSKMPPGSDVMKLWKNIGLLDGDLRPKPAWAIWKREVARAMLRSGMDAQVPR